MPGDEDLLTALADGIARLNQRYEGPPGAGSRFLLLHRRRLWNEKEGKWIGWERKRGKLHELNRLLRGAKDTTFIPVCGQPPTVPQGVRYVLTLDADTRLPKASAYRLVGAAAHPLNRPRFDPRKGRVVEGYAILQPRITPSLPTGPESTAYQRIVSGPGGVDPYAAAVSDVYQDLFEEGSYTGKGIYDVDAFEAALEGKVPENALLSHDLFEGLFARAGLVTDVDLFEEFPTNYEVAARRHHRWVRGDWQLLPWILGHARDAAGRKQRVRIPTRGRWKMVDNLRRSLVAPFSFLVAVAGWTLPAVPPLLWTGLLVGSVAVPTVIPVLDGLLPRRWGISKRSHLRAVGHDISVALSQTLLAITMLAHQAWLMVDAVVRTLGRLYVTKRNLLEWVTAAQAGYGADLRLRAFYRHLRWGVVLAVGAGFLFVVLKPEAWPVAAPFVLLWVLAPVLAWRMSVPAKIAKSQILSPQETRSLRLIARRTWRFFETFVDEEEHALPPDNFQEDPEPVEAHRTSPTNLGLYLLSTVVAHDFGWIGILDTVERLEATLETMAKLRRVRGHFCNWYDTRDLRPLEPIYVSTVDSGNLAGHLIALAQACRELMQRPPFGPEILEGVRDALQLVLDSVEKAEHPQRTQTVTAVQLREAAAAMSAALEDPPTSLPEWAERLEELEAQAENLLDIARTLSSDSEDGSRSEVLTWAGAVRDSVQSHARDLETTLPEAATTLGHRLSALALLAEEMVQAMDFRFLFDSSRRLFSIGYRVADGTLDPSSYDLLASEARLASFVAIAKGDVSPRHWFLLGRSLTPVGRGAALVSWSGSMFEYLMPLLVMRQPAQSLLDLTCRLVVGRQIRYGAERRVPWGVSESAYNVRDVQLTYQYSGFGVPGLGLKRGLFEDVVVAPYATALAAMVDPRAALNNFARLEEAGARGVYGFYEALDYTPSRLPEQARVAVVRAYMAHHQGMTLVSLGNVVHDGLTRRRFHAHPLVQAAELLLQERTPRAVAVARPRGEEVREAALVRDLVPATLRRFESPHDITPRTHLLSNGRYTVMVTAAGSGFSRWGDLAVTRWREDTTRDCWGSFLFLRDAETGDVWSAGFQPSGTEADAYDVVYSEDRAKIMQRHRSLSIALEIVVSPEDDAELRRLTVTNLENHDREIDVTSYAEVVLAPQGADEAHPAFSNLFVETEFVPELGTLLATRRPRSAVEPQVWLAHLAAVEGETVGELQYESDRARFLGRGRGVRTPLSVVDGGPLSNTAGTVLDPIVSLRHRVAIPARRDGQSRVHHARGAFPGRGSRDRGEVPPAGDVRARKLAGLDTGPGPAAPPPDHPGRGASLPASGQSSALRRSHVARGASGPGQEPRRPVRALGLRHLRRSSDRSGAHRDGRGAGRREAARAGARVLAPEGDFRRSGDPQCERHLLRAGSPGVPRSHGASEPVRGRPREACGAWRRVRAPGRPPAPAGPDPPARGGASGDPGAPGYAVRAGGAAAAVEAGAGPAAAPLAARERPRPLPPPHWISSSSTAWEDSHRTAGNTSRFWARGSGPRLPGSTWWPTRGSVSRSPSRARAIPGPRTAGRTSSRRGRTIPSATRRARRSMCAMRTVVCSGGRPVSPSAKKPGPMSSGTVRGTVDSSTHPTASRWISCSSYRCATRSRSLASLWRIGPAANGGFR